MFLNRNGALGLGAILGLVGLLAAPLSAAAAAPTVPANQVLLSGIAGFSTSPTPAFPSTFDWTQRARAYDAFVYDWTDRGSYTTIYQDTTAYNMPAGSVTYKMPAYYGDTRVTRLGDHGGDGYQEAVTQFASVLSGTLVGIDKSDQACGMPGRTTCDYVDMLRTFVRPSGVPGNTPVLGSVGDGKQIPGTGDGWYQFLPSVLYSMVAEHYPDEPGMTAIQRTVADRFYDMVVSIGGANADFTMQDYDFVNHAKYVTSRDESAELGAATAAVLLWAYESLGDARYLQGARWTMDAMERDTTNTYYEIIPVLLPYLAARMNALYGTDYDVVKYFRWLMKDSSSRGGWGTMGSAISNGTPLAWGGHDVSGLSGSLTDAGFDGDASTKGYAFAMNSFATTLLAATAKYDTRYADSVGRWMLNIDNASRFFFADQLTGDEQQYGTDLTDGTKPGVVGSSTGWAADDRSAAIAYEAVQPHATKGIYATSDVPTRSGSWGTGSDAMGLGMYGSSWIGLMSIIHPTNVPNVLRTDLDALDPYGEKTYPTSLYYNPTGADAAVSVTVGSGAHDLYDTVSRQYLARGVTGTTSISVPRGGSVVLVTLPAGAPMTSTGSITRVDGAAVAYDTNPQRDLARGADAKAGGVAVAALTDGSDVTAWTTTSSASRSAVVDLGSARQVGGAVLGWGASAPPAYTVDASLDGSSWSTVSSVTSSSGTDSVRFPARSARYLRVSIPTPPDGSATYALRDVTVRTADLALGAKVSTIGYASSINPPSALTDGSSATRWESPTQDAVWATVDLGSVQALGSVQLQWETAAAKAYTLKVSDDGQTWSAPVASVTDGESGQTRTLTLPAGTEGRYVRLDTSSRTTSYAHSLYRFSVYGATGTSTAAAAAIGTSTTVSVAPATQQAGATEAQRSVATVRVASDTGEVPTGTVELREGTTVLGRVTLSATAQGAATAALRLPALDRGTHAVQAVFMPAASTPWVASTSAAATLVVAPAPVTLTATPVGAVRVGAPLDLQVTARTTAGWSGDTVLVTVPGSAPVNVAVPASGTARVRLAAPLSAGALRITVGYAGSSTLAAATTTAPVPVAKAVTRTTLKAKKKVQRGKKLRIRVEVAGAAGVSLQGRANIVVKGLKSKKLARTVKVSKKGVAVLKVRAARAGRATVKATYHGNANQSASKAKKVKVKVRR